MMDCIIKDIYVLKNKNKKRMFLFSYLKRFPGMRSYLPQLRKSNMEAYK